MQKVNSRSYVFTEKMSEKYDLNLHLILGEENNYLIDTGMGINSLNPIFDFLSTLDSNKPLITINTHCHWDHIWGNQYFKNGKIISHYLCRELIHNEWDETVQALSNVVPENLIEVLPNITFDSKLSFPNDSIEILYTPGHTIDSICIIDHLDKVINVGDNIGDDLIEIIPQIDEESGSTLEMYKETVALFKSLDVEKVISGHNVVLGRDIFDKIWEELQK